MLKLKWTSSVTHKHTNTRKSEVIQNILNDDRKSWTDQNSPEMFLTFKTRFDRFTAFLYVMELSERDTMCAMIQSRKIMSGNGEKIVCRMSSSSSCA